MGGKNEKVFINIYSIVINLYTGCSGKTNEKIKAQNDNKIKTETYYRGFYAWNTENKKDEPPPQAILIISTQKDWSEFVNTYLHELNAVLSYLDKIDFNKYYIVYQTSTGAKPMYNVCWPIVAYEIKNNELIPIGSDITSDRVFSTDSENCIHYSITINLINKKDIPETVKNKYSKL